jgi:hypothetical protein
VRILLWPFLLVWRVIALILSLTGRLLGIALGFVFITVGVLLTLTGIGAVIGIPLIILGFLLISRGLF